MESCREEVLQWRVSKNVGLCEPNNGVLPKSVVCAFSSRQGGVSTGAYTSLNLGLHVGDRPDNVVANRRRFASAIGIDLEGWVAGNQVHGKDVAVVGRKDRGRGAFSQDTSLAAVDALVTNEAGVWLTCYCADCVPLIFWDAQGTAVGVAHAGWRGTLAKVGLEVVAKMVGNFGCAPERIHVLIGPAVGSCCYSVSEELARLFEREFGSGPLTNREGQTFLDLKAANREYLVRGGIPPDQIYVSGLCTSCLPGIFFSHRRDKSPTGRMAAVIGLRER
ncbi:MAG TPA: peptidoglycan editing factor PgeF [Firmicutes bacterium]|nr:peptidoglycan editing factor PgeF [Bacillota bacterium]